ncbi:Pkinase-domain-containing protein [Neocallimastix sp. 'constans']|jgi:serine/threonine-protein kinase Chk2
MSNNINKGISVIQSSFVSSNNNGLLNDKEEIKQDISNINKPGDKFIDNSEKKPLIIPSSFISSSESNSKDKKLKVENREEDRFNIKNKNIRRMNNNKKIKSKVFKGFLTRVLNEEFNECPINDCWLILNSIDSRFHSLRLPKKYLKDCYIGRNERNYLQIKSDLISGLHCKIFYKHKDKSNPNSPIEVFITDTSTNGTFINKKIIGRGKTKQLYHGQEIGFIIDSKKGNTGAYIVVIPRLNEVYGEYERTIEEDFQISETLGTGNFAEVKKGKNRYNGESVAIKILEKERLMLKSSQKMVQSLEREINILKNIKHENIIQIYDVYEDEKRVYLVLELAEGGELFDRIKEKSLTEDQARDVMRQLFEALDYLHDQGIAHRDLKPENILLVNNNADEFKIKISDFGLARFVDENLYMKTLCGTLTYAAPEVTNIIKNKEGKYTIAVDMWSCGVILYVSLSGYLPFNENQQIKKNTDLFKYSYWNNISNEAKDLIKGLLTIDPNKRLNVKQALKHPFITGYKDVKGSKKRTLDESINNDGSDVISTPKQISTVSPNKFSPSRSLNNLTINENGPLSKRQMTKK